MLGAGMLATGMYLSPPPVSSNCHVQTGTKVNTAQGAQQSLALVLAALPHQEKLHHLISLLGMSTKHAQKAGSYGSGQKIT